MKKILSVILALTTVFSLFSFNSSAANEKTAKESLRFNEDGSFKILQISDIQDIVIFRPLTKIFITDLLEKENPDLVVLTGDNIAPGASIIKWLGKKSIDKFMCIFEEHEVPVAIVYGNHDAETRLNKEEQWEIYESYSCFIGVRDSRELTGYGTYYLPVLSSEADKQKFTLWFFDSQEYNTENDLGGYGCVAKDQIEWYKETESALAKENGGKVIPSFAFQHIIPPEIFDVLCKVSKTDTETGVVTPLNNKTPILGEKTVEDSVRVHYKMEQLITTDEGITFGFPEKYADEDTFLSETCCPPKYTNGQADAFVEHGKVLGVAVGHDHKNSFVIPYKSLDIVQTPTASFGSYGDINRGARVITLNEKNLSEYETDVIFFRDYYDLTDEKLYNRYVFNSDGAGFSAKDRIKAALRYCFTK